MAGIASILAKSTVPTIVPPDNMEAAIPIHEKRLETLKEILKYFSKNSHWILFYTRGNEIDKHNGYSEILPPPSNFEDEPDEIKDAIIFHNKRLEFLKSKKDDFTTLSAYNEHHEKKHKADESKKLEDERRLDEIKKVF